MLRRNTLALLVVFFVLVIAAVLLQRSGKLEPAAETTPAPTQLAVFPFNTGEISGLEIESNAGTRAVYQKAETGSWTVIEPAGGQADLVESTVNQVLSWAVTNELASAPPIEEIGLSPPQYTVTLMAADGQTQVVEIGLPTPTGSGYYARLNGGKPFVVAKFSVDPVLENVQPTPAPPVLVETPAP